MYKHVPAEQELRGLLTRRWGLRAVDGELLGQQEGVDCAVEGNLYSPGDLDET